MSRPFKYPLKEMKCGEFFFAPGKNRDRLISCIRSCAHGQLGSSRNFLFERCRGGVRVFKVKKRIYPMYKIESGIPIPQFERRLPTRHPLHFLGIKESYFVECEHHFVRRTAKGIASITNAYENTPSGKGKHFILRCYENGVRVWRVRKPRTKTKLK